MFRMFYLFVRKDCTQSNYYATKGCLRGNHMKYLYPVALIASRISYTLSAWGGFLTGQQINKINVFFRKVRRFGLCSSTRVCDVSEYLSLADSKQFKSIQSPSHCLSHILPPEKNLSGLCSRGHGYVFPICQYSFCKKLFYSPMLISFL